MIVTIKGCPIDEMVFIRVMRIYASDFFDNNNNDSLFGVVRSFCRDFRQNQSDTYMYGSVGFRKSETIEEKNKRRISAIEYSKHAKDIISKDIEVNNEDIEDFIYNMELNGMIVITNRDKNLEILFDDNQDI